MTKRLFPITQWSDANGVLASGTVETFEAGTSTQKDTFTDRAGGSTNANPLTLDSNGIGQLWMDTDTRYKIVVKDSSATTVLTLDEVVPSGELLDSGTTSLEGNLDVVTFSIISSLNRDIAITPNGNGSVVLDGLNWPQSDGTNGQVIQTNGSGQLSFATVGTGSMDDVIDDTTPQLGGTLDTNAFNIEFDDAKGLFDDSSNEQLILQKTASAVNHIEITNASTTNAPLISAAGDDSNIDLSLQPKSGGKLILDTHTWPNTDGSANQILQTNGSGVLSFTDASTGNLLQYIHTTSTSEASTTTIIPYDDTVPQNTEGAEYITATITPTNTNSTLEIEVFIPIISKSGNQQAWIGALFQDSTADALCAAIAPVMFGDHRVHGQFHMKYYMTAGTTSSTEFKFRYGPSAGTAYINTIAGTSKFGTIPQASMIIKELSE